MSPGNLGPLTTTWTQPATCSHLLYLCQYPDDCLGTSAAARGSVCTSTTTSSWTLTPITTGEYRDYDSIEVTYFEYFPTTDPACWPQISSSSSSINGRGFYSPGLICPNGHTTACESTAGGSYDYQFDFTVADGETAVGCCPSSYQCGNVGSTQTCMYTASSIDTFIGVCRDGATSYRPVNVPSTYTIQMQNGFDSAINSQQVIYAPMIRLNWHSSDLPSSTSSQTLVSQTAAAAAPAFAKGSSHGLPTRAKAGIGVGVTVGTICVIGLLAWFVLRHRRSKKPSHDVKPEAVTPGAYEQDKHESPGGGSWAHDITPAH